MFILESWIKAMMIKISAGKQLVGIMLTGSKSDARRYYLNSMVLVTKFKYTQYS